MYRVMDTCADVRSSSPTSGGGFDERELAAARWAAACRGNDARLGGANTELAELGEERKRPEAAGAYAHRLAIMLERALLDPTGTWNDAHALLDEYRAWTGMAASCHRKNGRTS